MADGIIAFLVLLTILAVLTQETFVVALAYLFAGAMLLGRWWSSRVISKIAFTRKFEHKVFPGETVPVHLNIQNTSLLPAVWLRVQDLYPLEVAENRSFQQVISLRPRETVQLSYNLRAKRRGYFSVGPFTVTSGDLLGLSADQSSEGGADHLIVYPRVVPFSEVRLPSRSPMGNLRTRQPVYEDPTRTVGKRDYHVGDSLRRIDWKSTASTGRLQTKLFEPSISLETTIFLNLNAEDYPLRSRYEATELAIVIAASLANWVIAQRQSAGLITNGFDMLADDNKADSLFPRKGRSHLMRILELLARIRAVESTSFAAMVNQERVQLSWGTTMVIITSSAGKEVFDELHHARRSGLIPVVVLAGENPANRQAAQMGKLYKIPTHTFLHEKDLDLWRK